MSGDRALGSVDSTGGEYDLGEVVRRIQDDLERREHGVHSGAIGDAEWNLLIRCCAALFRGIVRRHRWPEADRDDGEQELWLMLIERLHALRYDPGRGDFRDWIAVAANHRLVDQERSRSRHAMAHLGPGIAGQLAGREPDPAESFERQCLRERVRDALSDLRGQVSSRDYMAFTLRWVDGLSIHEISEHLEMTERQVWASHHRAIRKLRISLAKRAGPEPTTSARSRRGGHG